ncbi:MAG: hypothetical protein WDW36_001955 [Sanguina aurantia]
MWDEGAEESALAESKRAQRGGGALTPGLHRMVSIAKVDGAHSRVKRENDMWDERAEQSALDVRKRARRGGAALTPGCHRLASLSKDDDVLIVDSDDEGDFPDLSSLLRATSAIARERSMSTMGVCSNTSGAITPSPGSVRYADQKRLGIQGKRQGQYRGMTGGAGPSSSDARMESADPTTSVATPVHRASAGVTPDTPTDTPTNQAGSSRSAVPEQPRKANGWGTHMPLERQATRHIAAATANIISRFPPVGPAPPATEVWKPSNLMPPASEASKVKKERLTHPRPVEASAQPHIASLDGRAERELLRRTRERAGQLFRHPQPETATPATPLQKVDGGSAIAIVDLCTPPDAAAVDPSITICSSSDAKRPPEPLVSLMVRRGSVFLAATWVGVPPHLE